MSFLYVASAFVIVPYPCLGVGRLAYLFLAMVNLSQAKVTSFKLIDV